MYVLMYIKYELVYNQNPVRIRFLFPHLFDMCAFEFLAAWNSAVLAPQMKNGGTLLLQVGTQMVQALLFTPLEIERTGSKRPQRTFFESSSWKTAMLVHVQVKKYC